MKRFNLLSMGLCCAALIAASVSADAKEVKASKHVTKPAAVEIYNINQLDQKSLVKVKGIGRARAQQIIAYRGKNGAFHSLDELSNLKGFSPKLIADLKTRLKVR